jgi:uncharacterized protein with PIN domain
MQVPNSPISTAQVKALGKQAQLKEVLSAFKLGVRARRLLCRCIRCNGDFIPTPLGPREASAAAPWSQVVPECALRAHTEFWQCSACRHIYWEVREGGLREL